MGILPDIDIEIRDGGLGGAGDSADILGVVGIGSVTQSSVVSLSNFEDVDSNVGDGPLRDLLEGVYSQVSVPCYARVLPGTGSTITAITPGSANEGVGSITASGTPANAYSIEIDIVITGGLNNGAFRVSKNGLSGKEVTIPSGGSYPIPGTGINLNFGAGSPSGSQVSFSKGDTFEFTTTSPSTTNGALLSAIDDLIAKNVNYRHIAVAGITDVAFWSVFATKLEALTAAHRWTWGSAAVRPRGESETTDAYISALTGSERGSVESKRLMVCASWLRVLDMEGYKVKRNAHGKIIGRIFENGVAISPGWTRLGNLPGVEGLLYEVSPTQIRALEDAGYATCRHYDGKKGVYVSESHLMTDATSDFDTSVRIEVMNKACRVVREAQFPYLKQGFDVLSDGRVPELDQVAAAGEQALDLMVKEKEISSGRIELQDKQNILSTKKVTEKIYIIPLGYIDEIMATIQFENPLLGGE